MVPLERSLTAKPEPVSELESNSPWTIKSVNSFKNSYYNWILKNNLEERALGIDIPGGIGFAPWRASNEGNIIMNHEEDMKNSETTYESILEEFNLN